MLLSIFIPLLFLLFGTDTANEADADQIIRESAERYSRSVMYSEISIEVIRSGWVNELGVKAWAKGDAYALVVITSPAKDRGNSFLKRDNNLWHWIPTIEKTVKMSSSMLGLPWMGTDFSINDLFNNHFNVSDYAFRLLPAEILRDTECYVIELLPMADVPIVWSSIRVWVSKADYAQMQASFYDKNGEMLQLMEAFDFKEFGDASMPMQIQITPLNMPGNKTIVRVNHYDFDITLEDGFFSLQNLKRQW